MAETKTKDAGGWRFVSPQDPSTLTMSALLRENFWLRELLEAQINAIEQRLDSGDKAIKLLQAFADRTPTTMDVQHQVVALREVTMEKFAGVKTAVDAAFDAAREAVGQQDKSNAAANDKSEKNFIKLIDAMNEQIRVIVKTTDDKLGDVKQRITVIESRSAGGSSLWALIVGGLGLLMAAGTFITVMARFAR
jgi:hypothetical protein